MLNHSLNKDTKTRYCVTELVFRSCITRLDGAYQVQCVHIGLTGSCFDRSDVTVISTHLLAKNKMVAFPLSPDKPSVNLNQKPLF